MAYQIHTYKDALETLLNIEKEEDSLRTIKSLFVFGGLGAGLIFITILFFTKYNNLSFIELLVSCGAAISLGPVFGFIYYSTQADFLSKRKQEFWNSLISNFSKDVIYQFKNEKLNEEDLKKILLEKIKEKISETLKYGY